MPYISAEFYEKQPLNKMTLAFKKWVEKIHPRLIMELIRYSNIYCQNVIAHFLVKMLESAQN